MKFLQFTFALSIVLSGHVITAASTENCKCVPSDPCWPAISEWDSLNASLGGRLIRSVPPGAVCYPSRPEYDAAACDDTVSGWSQAFFHSADPVSIDSPAMANDSCNPIYPNGTSVTGDASAGARGCSIGLYPPYVVNATDTSHVVAALQFVKKWNLRLNIKNTGHNGSGRNVALGSLSIWTHNMKQIQFHESFKPQGSDLDGTYGGGQMAATLGAGVQDGELFAAMASHDAIAVGGTNSDVGVVGWATGGGHGLATGHYGMGADNIVEAVVVTPDEQVLTANEYQNSDLFWAIRGGGGGTFGVICSVTVKAYPMPSVTLLGFDVAAPNGTSSQTWYKFLAEFNALLPEAQDKGLHGYWTMGGGSSSWAFAGALFLYDTANETAKAIHAPIISHLSSLNGTLTYNTVWSPSWYSLVKDMPAIESVGTTKSISASRLISIQTVTERQAEFAQTLEELGPRSTQLLNGAPDYSLSGIFTISRKPVDSALNPAWRKAAVHLISSRDWDDSLDPSIVNKMIEDMTFSKLNTLRLLEPDSGAYFNEGNAFEPGWQWSFFGANYGRLHAIKAKYDPNGILWCPQCVGSEEWVQTRDGLLCRSYRPLERL